MDPLTPPVPPVEASAPTMGAEDKINPKKRTSDWLSRIEVCKGYKRKIIPNWRTSIDYRRGKPFASQSDQDRISVNLDWSLTKTKQATLFSQVPKVRVDHPPETVLAGPWLHTYQQRINDNLILAGIESSMDEVLPDVINAAGFGAVIVAHESITEDVEVPATDLSMYPQELVPGIIQSRTLPDGSPLQMTTVPRVCDHRYTVTRLSPSDLLWPINFTGSDFDNAPWVGRSGRMTWVCAQKQYKLTDADKKLVLSEDKSIVDKLTNDVDKERTDSDESVSYDEIFYKSNQYDPDCKSFSAIHHLVFIKGKDLPVLDEPWKGQQINPDTNQIIGSIKFAVRFLTLSYLTDECIPPSDSAIARPQIDELNKSRTQTLLQRERSIPIRWFDVNRVDPAIQHSLMRGTWQAMIPVQGQGGNIIGEVAKATMPPENFTFDKIAKNDAAEAWSIGPNQIGVGDQIETKGEATTVEANFQTRIGRERAKVGKFFCTIAEVLGGLMCIFEAPESFGEGYTPEIGKSLTYSVLADSTVLLDSNQRLEKLINFVNFGAKSGWVVVEPVLKEIATLSGLDPSVVIQPPQPKPPVEPNISIRLTGAEDMMNPLLLAFAMKSGQAPSPELIEQAKQLIAMTVTPAPPPPPPLTETGPDGSTKIVPTPEVKDDGPKLKGMMINLAPSPPAPPSVPGGPPGLIGGGPVPSPPPPGIGEAHPNWAALDRINKRTNDREGGNN